MTAKPNKFIHVYYIKSSTHTILSFPKRQISDYSNLKVFADNNFKFDEINRKFSKKIENNVGKGEIARYKQFLLFPLCFQKTCFADT